MLLWFTTGFVVRYILSNSPNVDVQRVCKGLTDVSRQTPIEELLEELRDKQRAKGQGFCTRVVQR